VRMNPMIQPRYTGCTEEAHARWEAYEWFAEPSAVRGKSLFERLAALDMDAVADGEVQDIQRLADLWLAGKVPNQPLYSDDQFVPVIGQGWFAEALGAWRALDVQPPAPLPVPVVLPRRSRIRAAWQSFRGWIGRRRTVTGAAAGPVATAAPLAMPSTAATNVVPGRAPVD